MKDCKVLSIDLAKNSFQVCLLDSDNKVIKNRKITRAKLLDFLRQQPRDIIVAMEACGSAHYWARLCQKMGFSKVLLIPAQHVKPFVGKQKNDPNDARAIGEAAQRPKLYPVPIKTIEQQDIKMLLSTRDRWVKERTRLVNHLRGHCAEYGVILSKGINVFRKGLPEVLECGENELSVVMRGQLADGYDELLRLDEKIAVLEKQIVELGRQREDYKRLVEIPGIGPINATAVLSEIGDGSQFSSGRDYAAYCGLVPRQFSSGDQIRSGGITKAGNRQLRTLLVHSARTMVRYMVHKDDQLSRWVQGIIARRGKNKAVVALANKLARISWAILRHQRPYHAALTTGV